MNYLFKHHQNQSTALESNDAHEQLESIQISTQVLGQSKTRNCLNLIKVNLNPVILGRFSLA